MTEATQTIVEKLRGIPAVSAQAAAAEIERLQARVKELEERQAWRPIETAPKSDLHIVVLTEAGSVVRVYWTALDSDTWGWAAATDGEHPRCWTDGFCWASNEDEEPSDPPLFWMPLPARAVLQSSGK